CPPFSGGMSSARVTSCAPVQELEKTSMNSGDCGPTGHHHSQRSLLETREKEVTWLFRHRVPRGGQESTRSRTERLLFQRESRPLPLTELVAAPPGAGGPGAAGRCNLTQEGLALWHCACAVRSLWSQRMFFKKER